METKKIKSVILITIMILTVFLSLQFVSATEQFDVSITVYHMDLNDEWDDGGFGDGAEIYLWTKCVNGGGSFTKTSFDQVSNYFEDTTPGEWSETDTDDEGDELGNDLYVQKDNYCEEGADHLTLALREDDLIGFQNIVGKIKTDVPSSSTTRWYLLSDSSGDNDYNVRITFNQI